MFDYVPIDIDAVYLSVCQVTSSERALQTELLIPALRHAEHAAPSRELHLQTKAKYQREMRDDLLGTDKKGKANRLMNISGKATPN